MSANIPRLKKMAKFLDELKLDRRTERFDLDQWTCQKFDLDKMSCGTAACAIGWAAKRKLFRGLTLGGVGPKQYPVYDEYYMSWDAVEKLFGLSFYDTQRIFSAEYYGPRKVTRKMVAARIRQFIKETGSR